MYTLKPESLLQEIRKLINMTITSIRNYHRNVPNDLKYPHQDNVL